jgi:hypothetical protein
MKNWELGVLGIRTIWADSPRCGARARSAGGRPCRNLPVKGRTRCRFHGGTNPGPIGRQNALRTGEFTREAKQARRETAAAARAARQQVQAAVAKASRLGRRLKRDHG